MKPPSIVFYYTLSHDTILVSLSTIFSTSERRACQVAAVVAISRIHHPPSTWWVSSGCIAAIGGEMVRFHDDKMICVFTTLSQHRSWLVLRETLDVIRIETVCVSVYVYTYRVCVPDTFLFHRHPRPARHCGSAHTIEMIYTNIEMLNTRLASQEEILLSFVVTLHLTTSASFVTNFALLVCSVILTRISTITCVLIKWTYPPFHRRRCRLLPRMLHYMLYNP